MTDERDDARWREWRGPVASSLSLLCQVENDLMGCERRLAFLERISPLEYQKHLQELKDSLRSGYFRLPKFAYRPFGDEMDQVACRLQATLRLLPSGFDNDPLCTLIASWLRHRGDELAQEAEIVRARGSSQVPALGKMRFQFDDDTQMRAQVVAEKWLEADPQALRETALTEEIALFEFFLQKEREQGQDIQIFEREIVSVAAVSGDGLVVRKGAKVMRATAERIWVHEVEGHLLPRRRSQKMGPPFRIGTPGCSEDEEGRAVFLEERGGYLDERRRVELAVRHTIACKVREQSEDLPDVTLSLCERLDDVALVAHCLCRALRGGGVAREAIYLPAYQRVKAALTLFPEAEAWMQRGRIAVHAARQLQSIFESTSMTVGA